VSDTVGLKSIADEIGPAPWYWRTFKPVTGESGQRFLWHLADYGKGRQYPVLASERGEIRFVAHTHTRAFPVFPNLFAAWFPVLSETPPRLVSEVRVLCFDPDKLPSISGPARASGRTYYSAGAAPASQFSISVGLPAGDNSLHIPDEFQSIDEMLIVGDHAGDETKTAIYAVYPKLGRVAVFPQLWFKGFDDGYQWITRVTRHPISRAFIGDGIRIGKFELTEDGCHLARWLIW